MELRTAAGGPALEHTAAGVAGRALVPGGGDRRPARARRVDTRGARPGGLGGRLDARAHARGGGVTLVACRAATKVYGLGRRRIAALERCSFTAEAGEIIGVVGPNGAGKTTLLSLIAGELPLSAGELRVAGHRAGTRAARRAVGFAPDPPVLPPDLTGTEWLTYLASHRARSAERRARLVSW
ncbi:MAG: ATP-binding cassette domain-containing protein, partial [Hyphomicrobiaceae bacterium]|nr:ATP-binding cassette domain-containing protein [Hyphomicrobiaceae bacterium]